MSILLAIFIGFLGAIIVIVYQETLCLYYWIRKNIWETKLPTFKTIKEWFYWRKYYKNLPNLIQKTRKGDLHALALRLKHAKNVNREPWL